MEYSLDLGPWNAVFAVPCALVDTHLKLAGKEQLQAILWVLRRAGESFSPEELAEALGISRDDALDALEYWSDRGVLAIRGENLRPLPQLESAKLRWETAKSEPQGAAHTEEAVQSEKAMQKTQQHPALPPKKRLAKPDAAYLAARVQESSDIRALLQEAEATLGLLSPAMTAVLLASVDDYGLSPEVVAMLIHYAKEVGKTSTAYIDSVARDWAQSGVFTIEAAEEKLKDLDERRLAWGKVSAAAGLSKRSPTKREETAAYRWVCQWRFSSEMLRAAYERCADNTGKFSAAYMDKVLERWHREGVRNLKEMAQAEDARSVTIGGGEKHRKSYDIDELEQISQISLPDSLK